MKIIEWLKLSATRCVEDLDDPAVSLLHAEIIQRKPFLRKIYVDFYKQFAKAVSDPEGKVLVELGSGGGFIKEIIGNVITSDILELPNVDRVFSAIGMPFEQRPGFDKERGPLAVPCRTDTGSVSSWPDRRARAQSRPSPFLPVYSNQGPSFSI